MKLELSLGALLDQLADLIPVAGSGLDDGEDDQLRGALLELAVEDPGVGIDIWHSHTCYSQIRRKYSPEGLRRRAGPITGRPGGRLGGAGLEVLLQRLGALSDQRSNAIGDRSRVDVGDPHETAAG